MHKSYKKLYFKHVMIIRILKSIFYKEARKQAQKLRGDKKGKEQVVDEAEKKAGRFAQMKGRFVKFYNDLSVVLRMLRAYISGEYKQLPWTAVFRMLTAVIYFVSIVDFIPDFLPMFGYFDDMAVITWVLASLRVEADKFLEWEKNNQQDSGQKETETPELSKKPLTKNIKSPSEKKPTNKTGSNKKDASTKTKSADSGK